MKAKPPSPCVHFDNVAIHGLYSGHRFRISVPRPGDWEKAGGRSELMEVVEIRPLADGTREVIVKAVCDAA